MSDAYDDYLFKNGWKSRYNFAEKSKLEANKYEWLYHCTSVKSMKNIIRSKEMWLTNLQKVNDKEEVKRIDVKEYEKSYYVACFTYDSDIDDEHWEEYSQNDPGVLFGMRREWFKKELAFLNEDRTRCNNRFFKIYNSFDELIDIQTKCIECGIAPYYVIDYGFYKIIYDDELKAKMESECSLYLNCKELTGSIITTSFPGIIKRTHGKCEREGKEAYDKVWRSEKEVRLKVGVKTNNENINESGVFFERMAINLSEDAFCEIPIKFDPKMIHKDKNRYLKEIKELMPNAKVYEI